MKGTVMRPSSLFLILTIFASSLFAINFPTYFEINTGETVELDGYPAVTLISKKVTYRDAASGRIGAAQATLKIGETEVVVPVGYENSDMIIGTVRVGVEVISDYEELQKNDRYHLTKDARIRIAHANQPLMPAGSHIYPLLVPWNNGSRTQGWLTACYNIDWLEGTSDPSMGRHHDGWDFGAWEGQLVRSVTQGIVVSPDDYPQLFEKGQLYNKNHAPVGGNPFLVKHPNLPLLYYYTHLSGLTRNFKEGEIIEKGEPLGYASSRGSSGGWYHLHFSMILIDDEMHVNPYPFLAEWYKESMTHYQDFLTVYKVYYLKEKNNLDLLVDGRDFQFKSGQIVTVAKGQLECFLHFVEPGGPHALPNSSRDHSGAKASLAKLRRLFDKLGISRGSLLKNHTKDYGQPLALSFPPREGFNFAILRPK